MILFSAVQRLPLFAPQNCRNLAPQIRQVFADNVLSLKRKLLMSLKTDRVILDYSMLDKTEKLMLHTSDQTSKPANLEEKPSTGISFFGTVIL